MIPYTPFRMSDRRARSVYAATLAGCILPLGLLTWLGAVDPGPSDPLLVGSFGVITGLLLVLVGAHGLRRETGRISPAASRLAESMDAWFPLLVFIVQNTALILMLTVLWFTVQKLGIQASRFQTVTLLGVFGLVPLRRFLDAYAHLRHAPRTAAAADALSLPLVMLSVNFIAASFSQWLSRAYEGIPGQTGEISSPPFLVLWIPTILVSLACSAGFVVKLAKALTLQPDDEGVEAENNPRHRGPGQ